MIRKAHPDLYVDIWWQEQIIAYLDQMPSVWSSFPELFAGGKVPILAEVVDKTGSRLSRAIRIALDKQYMRDSRVKFLEIEFERDLSSIFVDLDVDIAKLPYEEQVKLMPSQQRKSLSILPFDYSNGDDLNIDEQRIYRMQKSPISSAISILLDEKSNLTNKILLEGGAGQGKSTLTQMAAQIYRQQLLGKDNMDPEGRWNTPRKVRLPFRIELRRFADWLLDKSDTSVEEYLSVMVRKDSGGVEVSVDELHNIVTKSPIIIIFDGLDEVGNDDLRDKVLNKISDCIYRFENNLQSDIKVIVTTRPPAIAGRREHLVDFTAFPIEPLENQGIANYVNRWLKVQLQDDDEEKQRVRSSFEKRQKEPYVQALTRNPMQLAILLNFIRLTSDAFPDRRADLYREYFKIVINRDVAKYEALRKQREVVENLHQFLGFQIHILTEDKQADGALSRDQLLDMVQKWLESQSGELSSAKDLFKLGQERLGLIVTLKGEGRDERYGFSIQPVREYFAAAYINEQVRGNAHDVFQAMVRRPYWREVALFLAGLRRQNEKADLIARCRALDNDEYIGWRQYGRSIILQLLQEGVFSQPAYVLSDALKFVVELLDPEKVPIQYEGREILGNLASVIRASNSTSNSKGVNDHIIDLIVKYKENIDEYIVYRIYYVISRIGGLNPILLETFLDSSLSSERQAKARLLWAVQQSIDLSEASKSNLYWEKVPYHVWSEYLWKTGIHNTKISHINIPSKLHQYLLEQFAFNPTPIFEINDILLHRAVSFNILVDNEWSIWRLVKYCQLLPSLGYYSYIQELKSTLDIADFNISRFKVSYEGLNKTSRELTERLIYILEKFITVAFTDQSELNQLIEQTTLELLDMLDMAGLSGWIVCRCITSIIRYVIYANLGPNGIHFSNGAAIINIIRQSDAVYRISKKITPFYVDIYQPSYVNIREDDSNSDLQSLIQSLITEKTPTQVRLRTKGKLVDVSDIIADNINHGTDLPWNWLTYIPFNGSIFRPLVVKCKDDLRNLSIRVNDFRFTYVIYGHPLLTSDVQKFLKIARQTDDPRILSGVLILLSTSKFIRMAGTDLILKLFQNRSVNRDLLRAIFFKGTRYYPETDQKELNIVTEVAQRILQDFKNYSFAVRCEAASHLIERLPVNLPPLLSEARSLDLEVV